MNKTLLGAVSAAALLAASGVALAQTSAQPPLQSQQPGATQQLPGATQPTPGTTGSETSPGAAGTTAPGAAMPGAELAQDATGTIEEINREEGRLVLDNGDEFEIDETGGAMVSLDEFSEGDEVRVSYQEENGTKRVISVTRANN
jgi:hypothetical protein